jgi:hypothetical protein
VADGGTAPSIETVRGKVSGALAEEILAFWAERSALTGVLARERLPQVLCVVRDDDGTITGVNSAHPENLELVGGRQFWVYRELLPSPEERPAMLSAAFDALATEFDPAAEGPLGLALVEDDPERMRAAPEAVWPGTQMLYAGRLPDGSQVRIRYFDEAVVIGGTEPGISSHDAGALVEGYRVEEYAGGAMADEVLAFWARETTMPEEEANRRVHEVHLVARDPAGELAGVSSAYLKRNTQLRLDLWHYRALVSAQHRKANLGFLFVLRGRQLLEQAFTDGTDRRGLGVIYEIENEGVQRRFNKGRWPLTGFTFIGEKANGSHVRLVYFPGAEIPPQG